MSTVFHLQSPFAEVDIRKLHVGDTVYFDGLLFGIRDRTQIYIFDEEHPIPVDLRGMSCIHTAPSLKRNGDKWEKICVGTTTSQRMERFSPRLIEQYGVRAIIGKGGLAQGSLDAMQKYGAVYLAIVGGAASLSTEQIVDVEKVYFEHLHPEALYQFRVKDFGPLTVAMDSHGNNLYEDITRKVQERKMQLYEKLGVL